MTDSHSKFKKCPKCKEKKELEIGFSRNSSKKDGFQSLCKTCSGINTRAYYESHQEALKESARESHKKKSLDTKKKILAFLRENPCSDCGEGDPVVLEFDHVRGKKNHSIVRMVVRGFGWDKIEREIQKCQVRCANCHRRKTAKDRGYFRLLFVEDTSG